MEIKSIPWRKLCLAIGGAAALVVAVRYLQRPKKPPRNLKYELKLDNAEPITNVYELDKKKLGEGSYGSVFKAKHIASGKLYAVKIHSQVEESDMYEMYSILLRKTSELFGQTRTREIYDKVDAQSPDKIVREIEMQRLLDHPNIVKLEEIFADDKYVYKVMEFCAGGQLFDRIMDAGNLSEAETVIVMRQLLKAIQYCHKVGVFLRCPKPEDFLFDSKKPIEKATLKLLDFSLACAFTPGAGNLFFTKCGTPYYVAPEILGGEGYDERVDLWSCGVIMYVAMVGYPPFYAETDVEVLSKVRLGNYKFHAGDWKYASQHSKNLIRGLLKMDPRSRLTADAALQSEFFGAPEAL